MDVDLSVGAAIDAGAADCWFGFGLVWLWFWFGGGLCMDVVALIGRAWGVDVVDQPAVVTNS